MPSSQKLASPHAGPPHLCLGCGSSCDDIDWTAPSLAESKACPLGIAWYGQPASQGPAAAIESRPVSLDEGVQRAYELLSSARHPLVTGLQTTTTEVQRAACALADSWGAVFDTTSSPLDADGTLAFQTTGAVTATYGEVAQRADVVLLWGCDPAVTHPRHFERYLWQPSSPWLPRGAHDRTLIVVDDIDNQSEEDASFQLRLLPGRHYEGLATLRMALRGLDANPSEVRRATGVDYATWQNLAERLKQARFGAAVYGKRLATGFGEATAALTQCMVELTRTTRWVAVPAGSPGNATGAINVATWQTGFPMGVRSGEGYPEYGMEWLTERVLASGEVDALVVVGDDLHESLSPAALETIGRIPTIAIGWRETPLSRGATVNFRAARPVKECGGTIYRADGVGLPIRPVDPASYPLAESILRRLVRQEPGPGKA